MSFRASLLELPLLLASVPASVQEWLRQAGVPAAPFRQAGAVLSSLRRTPGRFVLYDSRSVSGRAEAEAARAYSLEPIDVAPLLQRAAERAAADGAPRGAQGRGLDACRPSFLLGLKRALERSGGLWARLADYPSPWQCAACRGTALAEPGLARVFELFAPAPGPRPSVATNGPPACSPPTAATVAGQGDVPDVHPAREWIRRRYLCGLPFCANAEPHAADTNVPALDALAAADEVPLLWWTSFDQFARWWRVRQHLEVRLQSLGTGYRIECAGDRGGFQPMLELWRGGHMASIPLDPVHTAVRTDGLLFQRQNLRHPAGFTSRWAEDRHWETHWNSQELQTA